MRSKPSRLALSGMAFAETASASTASIHQPALCPDRYRYCTILWDHRHIYVANTGNSTVSVFTISTTGQLTQVGSNFIVTGATTAFNVLADPTGKYLYVLDSPGTAGKVFAFNLDQTTGAIHNGDRHHAPGNRRWFHRHGYRPHGGTVGRRQQRRYQHFALQGQHINWRTDYFLTGNGGHRSKPAVRGVLHRRLGPVTSNGKT
jgi:hypothetical protein